MRIVISLGLCIFFSLGHSNAQGQLRAIVQTDKTSYRYGETMEICRYVENVGADEGYFGEEGCCSDEVLVNDKLYRDFYFQQSEVGACSDIWEPICHLGILGHFISAGETRLKNCNNLKLVSQDHCVPDFLGLSQYSETYDFEVQELMRIQVFIEDVGYSEILEIPVDMSLPVELEALTADYDGSQIHLTWSTLSESNNAFFDIEIKEANELDYRPYARLSGSGSSQSRNEYSHSIPGLSSGTYSFKLFQMDFDGSRHELASIEVDVPISGSFELSPAFPNPSSGIFQFDLKVRETQHVEISIHDVLGRQLDKLLSRELRASESLRISSSELNLPTGNYIYRVLGEHFLTEGIVIIQK